MKKEDKKRLEKIEDDMDRYWKEYKEAEGSEYDRLIAFVNFTKSRVSYHSIWIDKLIKRCERLEKRLKKVEKKVEELSEKKTKGSKK